MLIEKPKASRPIQAPPKAIGTTIAGISVARQFWRNRNITRKTRIIASTSVWITLSTEAVMNGVVVNGTLQVTSAGKLDSSAFIRADTASAVASAFAPLASWTARPTVSLPFRVRRKP